MELRLAEQTCWRAWVLEADAVPVGNIWLQLVEKLPNPVLEREVHGYVTNLFVRDAHRGKGGGSLLLGALLSECESSGVDSAFLWPTPQSTPLYERHGFVVADAVMLRAL